MQAVFSGMGGKSFDYDDPNNDLVTHLRHNVFAFSAAKSLTQMQVFNDLLVGADGKPRSQADFTAQVAKTGAVFNKVHLSTERDSALAQAQMAQVWNGFNDDEYIQISTAGDDKVRPWHASLDGFTALKSDPVWRRLWPPFDWKCRCHAIPGIASKAAKDFHTGTLLKDARIPMYFQSNSGVTKTVFDENLHPHFENYKGNTYKGRELRAEVNYAMASVEKLYANNNFPKTKAVLTEPEAYEWFENKAADKGYFDIKDVQGATLRCDSEYIRHVIQDHKKQKRYEFISNTEDIVKDPDEIWNNKNGKGDLIITYIKYYDDFPYTVNVDNGRTFSMYKFNTDEGKVNTKSINQDRTGVLIYRKN